MSRVARMIPAAGYLHVYARGNNRRKLFLYPRDFEAYLAIACKTKIEEAIKIHHYCLMPNHVHFLVGVGEESDLSVFMKRLNLKYSRLFQKKRRYVGHLWQGRFKSKLIDEEAGFLRCGKYIELNPVRANIAKRPQDYPYSSYCCYALGKQDRIVDADPLYANLGNTAEARQLHYRAMMLDETILAEIRI